jgi:hypothetical protein
MLVDRKNPEDEETRERDQEKETRKLPPLHFGIAHPRTKAQFIQTSDFP